MVRHITCVPDERTRVEESSLGITSLRAAIPHGGEARVDDGRIARQVLRVRRWRGRTWRRVL